MSILGGILIILGLPLLLGYAISEKKNKTWLRLGLIMGGIGLLIMLFLSSCAAPTTLQPTSIIQIQTVVVTQLVPASTHTPQPTYTPAPTYTPVPPIIITATPIPFTSTPINTPTPTVPPTVTKPPTVTPLPTAAPNLAKTATAEAWIELTSPKKDGFYLVNIDIAPGVWRSQGTSASCYWKRSTKSGGIIDNHFGQSGGTIYIAASDFQIQFRGCGAWIYLGQ